MESSSKTLNSSETTTDDTTKVKKLSKWNLTNLQILTDSNSRLFILDLKEKQLPQINAMVKLKWLIIYQHKLIGLEKQSHLLRTKVSVDHVGHFRQLEHFKGYYS